MGEGDLLESIKVSLSRCRYSYGLALMAVLDQIRMYTLPILGNSQIVNGGPK